MKNKELRNNMPCPHKLQGGKDVAVPTVNGPYNATNLFIYYILKKGINKV